MTQTAVWQDLRGQRAIMLTTYKKDGTGVGTPVGFAIEEPVLYFMTDSQAWKVRRLARTPRVEIAASTLRGQVRGPSRPGSAREVTGAQAEHAHRLVTAHNRLAWFLLLRRARKQGKTWRYYAVEVA